MSKYSHSQIKLWRRCQKAWEYKYIHKLTPKSKSDALNYGTFVHKILDEVNKGVELDVCYDKLWSVYSKKYFIAEIQDVFEKAFSNIEDYYYYWEDEPLEVLDTEIHVEKEIAPGIIIHGYADGLVKDSSNRHWLLENKTGKKDASSEARYWDLQAMIYHPLVSEKYDLPLSGTIWNWITSGEISYPRILKNGTISRAVSQRTTWRRYEELINEHGFDVEDYKDMREIFEARTSDFFSRRYLPYEEDIADQLNLEVIETIKDINVKKDNPDSKYPRSMDRHCSWCNYQSLCKANLTTPLEELEDFIEEEYEIKKSDRTKD